MRIKRNAWTRLLIGLAVVALLILVRYTLPSTTFSGKPKSGPVAHITTFGKHLTPESDWVESISVTEEEDKLVLFIQERPVTTSQPTWWNPVRKGYSERGLRTRFPMADEWSVSISDERQTVAYEAGNYRWTYDSLDPNGTIGREEYFSPDVNQ